MLMLFAAAALAAPSLEVVEQSEHLQERLFSGLPLHGLLDDEDTGFATGRLEPACGWCHLPAETAGEAGDYSDIFDDTRANKGHAQPRAGSLICLGCHDGALAHDVYRDGPGTLGVLGTGARRFGTTSTGEHPVSMTYTSGGDFQSIVTAEAMGLVFFGARGDQVECETCHDPHGVSRGILRLSNQQSTLCMACHIK